MTAADVFLQLNGYLITVEKGGVEKFALQVAKENLLDEIILNVEPVFVGNGVPLFAPQDFKIKAKLISADKAKSGIITLKYEVLK